MSKIDSGDGSSGYFSLMVEYNPVSLDLHKEKHQLNAAYVFLIELGVWYLPEIGNASAGANTGPCHGDDVFDLALLNLLHD